jgi:ferric-dicitrate binding protein FerR (iron transport regulator)
VEIETALRAYRISDLQRRRELRLSELRQAQRKLGVALGLVAGVALSALAAWSFAGVV